VTSSTATSRWKVWVTLAAAFILGESLFTVWPDSLAAPDLLAAVVVAASLSYGPVLGAQVGFVGGLAQGLVLGRLVGLDAALLALLAWMTGAMRRSFVVESPLLSLFIAFLAILIERVVLLVVLHVLRIDIGSVIPGIGWVTLETLPFFLLARWIIDPARRDHDRIVRGRWSA